VSAKKYSIRSIIGMFGVTEDHVWNAIECGDIMVLTPEGVDMLDVVNCYTNKEGMLFLRTIAQASVAVETILNQSEE
jgi:hypothetical protein